MDQSREAHCSARPLHSPEGGQSAAVFAADWPPSGALSCTDARKRGSVGYAICGAGNDVKVDVGNDVGSLATSGPGARASPVRGAGLRSLPAKQHAPKARPTTDHAEWPAGVVPGRPSSTNGLAAWNCAVTGCRTFALDRRASLPWLRHERPGDPVGQYAGGRHPTGVVVNRSQGERRHRLVVAPVAFRGVNGRCRRSCRRCRPGRSPECPGAQTARRWDSARRG